MTQTPTSEPSPFRGRWLWASIAIALLCALFVTLGFWQLARLGQRRAANARIVARMEEPALALDGAALDAEAADLRRAVVRGTYDFSQEIVLRNRTHNEIPGVHSLVPLRIAGSDAAVLVDRGWIPYELATPELRARFHDAAGEVAVRGVLRRSVARTSSLSPADPPLSRRCRGWTPGTVWRSRASGSRCLTRCSPFSWKRSRRNRPARCAASRALIPISSSAKVRTWVTRSNGLPSRGSRWRATRCCFVQRGQRT